jgi:hypothetical protein
MLFHCLATSKSSSNHYIAPWQYIIKYYLSWIYGMLQYFPICHILGPVCIAFMKETSNNLLELCRDHILLWNSNLISTGMNSARIQVAAPTIKYTIWSKVSRLPLETVIRLSLWHTSQSWTLIPGGPNLCFLMASTWPERLSTRCLNISSRMAAHSSCRDAARAVSDVRCWGLEWSWPSNSSHRCSMGFRSGLWAG